MGSNYEFWLKRVDYTVETASGFGGTDSRVELEIHRKSGGKWEVISTKAPEPGDTDRLDAGKKESFVRTFADPLHICDTDDPLDYQKNTRFRFKILGDDQWQPTKVKLTATFMKRQNTGGPLVYDVVEKRTYSSDTWILSTDPAEGGASTDKDGKAATLTLLLT